MLSLMSQENSSFLTTFILFPFNIFIYLLCAEFYANKDAFRNMKFICVFNSQLVKTQCEGFKYFSVRSKIVLSKVFKNVGASLNLIINCYSC